MDGRDHQFFGGITRHFLLFVLGMSLGLAALAQTTSVDDIDSALAVRGKMIDKISGRLDTGTASESDLANWLLTLTAYQADFKTYADQLQAALAVPADRLAKLGPPPAEGQPPESADIAGMRKKLTGQVSRLNGLSKGIELAGSEANDLIDRARALQRDRSRSLIQTRSAPPFTAQLWTTAGAGIVPALERFSRHFEDHWQTQRSDVTVTANIVLLLVALGVSIALVMLPRIPRARQLQPELLATSSPSALDKIRSIAFRTLGHGLLVTLAGMPLLAAVYETGWLADGYHELALRIWLGCILWVIAWHYTRGIFSPHNAGWRRVPIGSREAARVRSLLLAILALFIFDRLIFTVMELTNAGIEVYSAHGTLSNSFFAALLWLTCSPRLWLSAAVSPQSEKADPAPQTSAAPATAGDSQTAGASFLRPWRGALLIACRVLAVIILVLTALGYISLANFIFHRIALVAVLVVLAGCVRIVARWAYKSLMARSSRADTTTSQLKDAHGEAGFWLGLTLDLTWVALCIPAIMFVVGFDWLDISRWIGLLSVDVNFGQVSVSFIDILTALLTLLFVNGLTRRLVASLDSRLLHKAHLGPGERASITTLVKYTGMVVSVLLALGIVGIGWTQLAIIAGALSVGIGFGLQSIANNFVSGLILLFERPVKVGDWVVVRSGEGYIRNIGARATEIETFDHSSVIVPNSELVSEAVGNWFYKTRRGRIRVQVGVSYDADPEQVSKILVDCAAQHSNVVNYPKEPRVRWLEFGDSSLDFELLAFIVDIENGANTRSDLHFAIFKALKDAGIEIPFPQRDLHIKSDMTPVAK